MPPFFSNKRLVILLASVIILVALIGYSMQDRKNQSFPEQFLQDTVGFFQSVVSTPTHMITSLFGSIEDIKEVYVQNKKLKQHLEDYAEIVSEVKRLRERNKELQQVLNKSQSPSLADYHVRQARVIARSPDHWNQKVIINKGSTAGIEQNMAVIAANGMIGKISSVGPFTSTVQLISSKQRTNFIPAMIQTDEGKKDLYGLVKGYNQEKNRLRLTLLPVDVSLEKGQTVVTSGLGGMFPQGLVIGHVTSVKIDSEGLSKIAFVKPSADLYDFYNVMVIERMAKSVSSNPAKKDDQ